MRLLIVEDEAHNHSWMGDILDFRGIDYKFVLTFGEVQACFGEGFTDFMLDHHLLGGSNGAVVAEWLVERGVAPENIVTIGSFENPGYPEGVRQFTKREFRQALKALGYGREYKSTIKETR